MGYLLVASIKALSFEVQQILIETLITILDKYVVQIFIIKRNNGAVKIPNVRIMTFQESKLLRRLAGLSRSKSFSDLFVNLAHFIVI